MDALTKERACLEALRAAGRVRVAFSGGVDSLYLLALAHEALGDGAEAVTADSPSLPRALLAEAQGFTAARGIRHRVVGTAEFADAAYAANDGNRCYHCKSSLMEALSAIARDAGPARDALGVIADDLGDWRPGMRAAAERGAWFPLAEHGFTKAEIRSRSRERRLPGWDRPAAPCLSSRVPYGEPVTIEGVRMVEAAESILHAAGFAACRARHHRVGADAQGRPRGWLCRIEVPADDLPRLAAQAPGIAARIRAVGYAHVALDLAGLESGNGNRLLSELERIS